MAYKYTGKERDGSTGLYFYEARYYDAALGRFISADTIVPDPNNPQNLNRYSYARNNPILYNDPSGHCEVVCIGIIVGAIVGGVSAGVQSDWDVQATFTGAVIGGIAGGVGAGVGGAVSAAVPSQYGAIAVAAGGLVGGAAAGGTSGVLYSAAGYNTNIGLAIGLGAAGGLAGGLVGGVGYQHLGLDQTASALAGAAASGALTSTISGADPGMAVIYAVGAAVLASSVAVAIENYQKQQVYVVMKDQKNGGRLLVSMEYADTGSCASPPCGGIDGTLTPVGQGNDITHYRLELEATEGTVSGEIWSVRKVQLSSPNGIKTINKSVRHLGNFEVTPGQNPPWTKTLDPPSFNGYVLLEVGGNANNPNLNGTGIYELKGFCSTLTNCR